MEKHAHAQAIPALLFEVSTHPPIHREGPFSYLGSVNRRLPTERWPERDGTPFHPLFQLNLEGVPYLPQTLCGVALLTAFVHPVPSLIGRQGGEALVVRTYSSLARLVEFPSPVVESERTIRVLDLPRLISDVSPSEFEEEELRFQGVKVGGYPKLFCSPPDPHPAAPHYTLQVNGLSDCDTSQYLERGTAPGFKKEWFLLQAVRRG